MEGQQDTQTMEDRQERGLRSGLIGVLRGREDTLLLTESVSRVPPETPRERSPAQFLRDTLRDALEEMRTLAHQSESESLRQALLHECHKLFDTVSELPIPMDWIVGAPIPTDRTLFNRAAEWKRVAKRWANRATAIQSFYSRANFLIRSYGTPHDNHRFLTRGLRISKVSAAGRDRR